MADLPPPPPGFTLDPPGAVPPPPPGFKLDAPPPPEKVTAPASASPALEKWGERMRGAELEPSSPKVDVTEQQTAFEQRKALQAQGKTTGDPEYDRLTKTIARGETSKMQDVADNPLILVPGAGGMARPALQAERSGAAVIGKSVRDLIRRATGAEAKEAAAGVRQMAAGKAGEAATAEEKAAAAAGTEAQKLKAGALKAGQPERVRKQVAPLEEVQSVARTSLEETRTAAQQAQARVADTEAAVDQLEKDLLAKPRTTPEQFGSELRRTTEQLHEKHASARAKEAGFDKALESAGDEHIVDTTNAQTQIEQALKDIRNPSLQRVLFGLRDLLTSAGKTAEGDVAENKLSVRAADSLRKYLDGVIHSKMFGDQAVDKETLYFIKGIKRDLVQAATEASQPYREALAKWRTLSRPLDIVERQGALRPVLDMDPVSTDYALTEAQVVGRTIAQAKAGKPVFTRLAAENPELRDSARLYFTQDLFGKDVVPTDASLRTWLKSNEGLLRQLSLYDEFRSIRAAKDTAQRAVEEAKGASKETLAAARQAQRQEVQTRQQLAKQRQVREQTQGKLVRRLEQRQGAAEKKQEKHEGSADAYRKFETELNTAVDKAVPSKTREFLSRLRKDGKINDKTYGSLLEAVNDADTKKLASEQMRKRMKAIGTTAILSIGGYEAYRAARTLLGLGM